MSPSVARIALESPLPQLGGDFDYLIPSELLDDIEPGVRVEVPVGGQSRLMTGIVTAVLDGSSFATREIRRALGPSMLNSELLETCKLAANRQVVNLGEVLRLAAPQFMPRIELPDGYAKLKTVRSKEVQPTAPALAFSAGNLAFLSNPIAEDSEHGPLFDWALMFISLASEQLQLGNSSILIVPEIADFAAVESAASALGERSALVSLSDKRKSERFRNFWRARLGASRIYLGTRSAVLHPAASLGLIAVFDDLDESLRAQASPYLHARELALIRAQASSSRIVFAAPYRSLEVERLVKIGFASHHEYPAKPARVSSYEQKRPPEFFKLIREGLSTGSALVLVPNKSWSTSAFCGNCGVRASCQVCDGPGFMPSAQTIRCRLCALEIRVCKSCGASRYKMGRAGASRLSEELGKAFPGVVIRDCSGGVQVARVNKGEIAVATPSSAPRARHGYAVLAILDCGSWLLRPSLRSEQFAIRDWQEAISLLNRSGRAALFDAPVQLGRVMTLQNIRQHAQSQLQEMLALKFPPAWRICQISGSTANVDKAQELVVRDGAEVVRRTSAADSAELLIRFRYSDGAAISQALREASLRSSVSKANRGRRALRIEMDAIQDL